MKNLENMFTKNEKLSIAELASSNGGAIWFDSSKGLYINGMEVDAWVFRLALMGFDVYSPVESDGNDHTGDVTTISDNHIETNY